MIYKEILLFGIFILLISFAKTLIINFAVSAIASHRVTRFGKHIVLKTSFSAIFAELIAFIMLTVIIAIQLVDSVYSSDFIYKVFISIQMSIYTLLVYPDYRIFSSVLLIVVGIIIAIILNIILNYFLIFKSKKISRSKRLLFSLYFSLLNAPYHFLISFGGLSIFNSIF